MIVMKANVRTRNFFAANSLFEAARLCVVRASDRLDFFIGQTFKNRLVLKKNLCWNSVLPARATFSQHQNPPPAEGINDTVGTISNILRIKSLIVFVGLRNVVCA